ncbi:hypothetical protein Acy02nite_10300 [Actinoplanes cyaneus]|uniref:Uncharacterized protein n=1 Tax=Actinoplanes cyaneus TaxID=52696 RepID=A0A919ICR1_9ACTN|nr:hypothetical protein [Actinoplanes cyaneus]MCW2137099.1 hypothetical protein [Actinoplanes cyaneus]GID63149.1 hypothetical protein Acy02nite_10300 [Actinoplanes cyaneus]
MASRQFTVEELTRFAVRTLQSAEPGTPRADTHLSEFFDYLVDLHALTPGGGLPAGDFVLTVVAELNRLRRDAGIAAEYLVDAIEQAGWDRHEDALRARSALQYVNDDFAGTAVAGMVEAETLADADEAVRAKLEQYGPADAEEVPAFVPVSHWWWDSSFRAAMPDWVTVYRIGEAPDAVRPVFCIADRSYSRPWLAEAAHSEASAALAERGFISSLTGFEGSADSSFGGLPTWEQFRQRHFVEGAPLPVRPVPPGQEDPPGWDAMRAEILRVGRATLAELEDIFGEAFPGAPTQVNSLDGPRRFSPASVYKHEELWGFRINVMVFPGAGDDVPPPDEVRAVVPVLQRRGWTAGAAEGSPDKLRVEAARGEFRLSVFAESGAVTFIVDSPRYRAPDEPGATWVIEPRS